MSAKIDAANSVVSLLIHAIERGRKQRKLFLR